MKRRDFLCRAAAAAGSMGVFPALLPSLPRALHPARFEESEVFVGGEGYPVYRIPSLITSGKGTLLAFSEGRQSMSDHARNDIVLRRSADGGRSWEPLQLVAEDGDNVLANPTAVEDRDTGRMWLMYQRYPKGFHEREVVAGWEGDRICRSFVLYSDDDGRTWSAPRETTRSVKRPEGVTSIASGPGVGIQLRAGPHRGRLIVPFNQGPVGAWKVYAVYSDDHGQTWRYGETAPDSSKGTGNEVQMVELADGTVMLNSRSQNGNRCRKVAWSRDGGRTWSALVDDPQLIESQCQGTVVRYSSPLDGQRSRILFANPASQTKRVNGTVRVSYDEGKSWPVGRTVCSDSFAYSCLSVLTDGTIGLLYERDDYKRITFARFDLAWLTNGQDGR